MSKKQQHGNREHKKPKQDKASKKIVADPFAKGVEIKVGSKKK